MEAVSHRYKTNS